jgi:hypothetical protein
MRKRIAEAIRNSSRVICPLGRIRNVFSKRISKHRSMRHHRFCLKKGDYKLNESESLNKSMSKEVRNDILGIWNDYDQWYIQYKERVSPLNAYLCTGRGFFNINLSSFVVREKCWPYEKKIPLPPQCRAQHPRLVGSNHSDPRLPARLLGSLSFLLAVLAGGVTGHVIQCVM